MDKPGRNALCWCGSGRKYKHCHLGREAERPVPEGELFSEMHKAGRLRHCLHPEASPESCGNVISAHTLQRSRVLEVITDTSKHVLTFFPPELGPGGRLKLHRRGWKQASTFTAFCDQHDGATFAPLEKHPFRATMEQVFLIAYRAVCWELHQKTQMARSVARARELIDRGKSRHTQQRVQSALHVQLAGLQKGLSDVTQVKGTLDKALLSGDYSAFLAYEVKLQGNLLIASTGAITPNVSLSGRQLQTLLSLNKPVEWLAFGVDITDSGASVVFFWPKGEGAPQLYMDEVTSLTDDHLGEFLVQFFFVHCENTYFATSWWESLKPEDQRLIEGLASNENPYFDIPEYRLNRLIAPWHVVARNYLSP